MSVAGVDTSATRSALSTLRGAIRNAEHQAIAAAVKVAEDSAKATTLFQDKTGATRSSIRGAVFGVNGTVTAGGVARFLENGTQPHVITGNPLAFRVNGATVFARVVHHPGTAPRPFMTTARDAAQQAAEYAAEYFVSFAIGRFGA